MELFVLAGTGILDALSFAAQAAPEGPLNEIFGRLIALLRGIGATITVVGIMLAAYKLLLNRGNPQWIASAWEGITVSLIGFAIIIGAPLGARLVEWVMTGSW